MTDFSLGTYAEYKCMPEDGMIAIKPANLSYEQATAVPLGGLHALTFLRKSKVQKGQKVLINGASGTIGTYAVQLAKYYGAEVTGIDRGDKLDTLASLGADHVIDYTKEDFTKSRKRYDVIFDVVGNASFSKCINMLNNDGSYLLANLKFSAMVGGLWVSITTSKKVIYGIESENPEDLTHLKELVEEGKIKPVIDRTYPLEEIVDAHRYVEEGHKKGNVVITV